MLFFVYLGLTIFFFMVLIKSTNMVIGSIRQLVISTKIGAYGLASFLLAFSTSLPEMMVSISAGLRGTPQLALGNVLGSNIANMTLVVGGAALVAGVLKASDSFLKRDVFYVFLAGALPLLLLIDGALTRVDGLILLMVYVLYNATVLSRQRQTLAKHEVQEEPLYRRILVKVSHPKVERSLVVLFAGVALLIISADLIVRLATNMAEIINIPVILVGIFIVGVGTSLPELATEITAIRKGEVQIAFGDVLGSVVANSTLVLGLAVMITPLVLGVGAQSYLIATLGFIAAFFIFWAFVWTKHTLERWEGAVLVAFYLVFAWMEIMRLQNVMGE